MSVPCPLLSFSMQLSDSSFHDDRTVPCLMLSSMVPQLWKCRQMGETGGPACSTGGQAFSKWYCFLSCLDFYLSIYF